MQKTRNNAYDAISALVILAIPVAFQRVLYTYI